MTEPLDRAPPDLYRRNAEKLRQLAAQIRFDLCRRQQLFALADGFERRARQVPPLKEAAD